MRYINRKLSVCAGLTLASWAGSAPAEVVTYNIIQNQSQISLTAGGTAFGGSLTVTEQQASATTRFNNTIVADVVGPSAGVLFPGAGSANAVNTTSSGGSALQYTPNVGGGTGSAAANYGVTMNAPVAYDLPSFAIPAEIIAQYPFLPATLDLGVLNSVIMKIALRDVTLEIDSSSRLPVVAGAFDANGTNITIASGFADVNIAARLTQPDIISKFVMQTLLSSLASANPTLGITVSTPSLFSLDIDLGFGFRTDLATLGTVPNTSVADGTLTGPTGPPGVSLLTLPVSFSLANALDQALGGVASVIDLNVQLDFAGTLKATASIPETSTILLSSLGMGMLALVRRRRS